MKRSEMVEKVINFLEDRGLGPIHEDVMECIALGLVRLVEEAGMLPHTTVEYIENGPGNSNTLCNEVNKWESECETPKCCGGGCHE